MILTLIIVMFFLFIVLISGVKYSTNISYRNYVLGWQVWSTWIICRSKSLSPQPWLAILLFCVQLFQPFKIHLNMMTNWQLANIFASKWIIAFKETNMFLKQRNSETGSQTITSVKIFHLTDLHHNWLLH